MYVAQAPGITLRTALGGTQGALSEEGVLSWGEGAKGEGQWRRHSSGGDGRCKGLAVGPGLQNSKQAGTRLVAAGALSQRGRGWGPSFILSMTESQGRGR